MQSPRGVYIAAAAAVEVPTARGTVTRRVIGGSCGGDGSREFPLHHSFFVDSHALVPHGLHTLNVNIFQPHRSCMKHPLALRNKHDNARGQDPNMVSLWSF